MFSNCCDQLVPHANSSIEALRQPVADWKARLTAGLNRSIEATDQTLGHLEQEIARQTRGLECAVAQEVAQKKADQTPPHCPKCGAKLTRLTHGHERTIQTRFGPITIKRTRGWCRRCKQWHFPADHVLGIEETGSASPSVQEMAALVGSKMPMSEASAVIKRLTGVDLPRATLDREAQRQGQRARRKRQELDEQMCAGQGTSQKAKELQLELALQAFTLVIELDAWNIRERDEWGQTCKRRAAGQEPQRWHWVYGGTCFRLSQRVQTANGRPLILSRGIVMTRGGIDALRTQLYAEALRQGLDKATEVLVIADGAIWIWNLVQDRFEHARQRLDLAHAKAHLWVVARALHPDNEQAVRTWVEPLLRNLERGRAAKVISGLKALAKSVRRHKRQVVQKEIGYFEANKDRMDYREAIRRGEPVGSGAMESTCRQYQCRFKRPGQFWSTQGDESLMCLETFWRNNRWHVLFPHSAAGDPSKN
jgi:hypothetical protein